MSRALCLFAAISAIAAASGAWAEEAIPTANDVPGGAPTEAKAPPSLGDRTSIASEDDIIRIGPCGAVQRASDPGPIDKKAHGKVDVAVGTRGYRHVGGVVCKPIGENGSVTVAIDYSEWNRSGRRHLTTSPQFTATEEAAAEGTAQPPDVPLGRSQ